MEDRFGVTSGVASGVAWAQVSKFFFSDSHADVKTMTYFLSSSTNLEYLKLLAEK
jgi:hypothetical protein